MFLFPIALRPAYGRVMPRRTWLSNTALDEVHDEVKKWNESRFSETPGRSTCGIDGFKDANKRHVMNLTKFKLGITSYLNTEWFGRRKHSGRTYASVVMQQLGDDAHLEFIAVVADNTSSMLSMFSILASVYIGIFFLGCVVHVLDLLIEDIVKKVRIIETTADDIRFVVVLIMTYSQLSELFREECEKHHGKNHTKNLVLYPDTRFAYVYLMAKRVLYNFSILMVIADSPEFKLLRRTVKSSRRGHFDRFEELFSSSTFKKRVVAVVFVLEPILLILHLNESDTCPIAVVPITYMAIFDFAAVKRFVTLPPGILCFNHIYV